MRSIVDFAPVLAAVMRTFVDRVTFVRGEREFEWTLEHRPRIVFALNHGPAHMPIVPIAALGRAMIDAGGGARRCLGITFRGLYLIPGIKQVASYLTQVTDPPGVEELIERASREEFEDVMIMPEGHNSAFGDPSAIQPFASPRFVELAVRMRAPIVLVVHSGLEHTATEVAAPAQVLASPWLSRLPYGLGDSLARMGSVAMPRSARTDELRMVIETYEPSLDLAAFEQLSPHAKRDWVAAEAREIRERMIAINAELQGQQPAALPSADSAEVAGRVDVGAANADTRPDADSDANQQV